LTASGQIIARRSTGMLIINEFCGNGCGGSIAYR
jgi:hypothetical protein